jgi:hypothetical protein
LLGLPSMKTKEQISHEGIGRRSFLLRISAAAIVGVSIGNFLKRFSFKKKSLAETKDQTIYPTINPLAVARKKKNA